MVCLYTILSYTILWDTTLSRARNQYRGDGLLDPDHARILLKEMATDLQISDIEYPLLCELTTGNRKAIVPTIWHTDESGQCSVKAVIDDLWDIDGFSLASTPITLKHRNVQLNYFIEHFEESTSFVTMTEETRLSGFVNGPFGDESQVVDGATFLMPDLPISLGQNRSVETLTSMGGGQPSRARRSDFGAMLLECDLWRITLAQLDRGASSQFDYKGFIVID